MTERMFDTRPAEIPLVAGDPDLGEPIDLEDLDDVLDDVEALRAELAAQDDNHKTITTLAVAGRPGWSLECRIDFAAKEIEALKGKAKDTAFKRTNGGIDPAKHAALIVGTMTKRILRNGRPIVLGGVDQTFLTRDMHELLGLVPGQGVVAAVRAMFQQQEGRIIAASDKLIDEAGWGDEADLADPTV